MIPYYLNFILDFKMLCTMILKQHQYKKVNTESILKEDSTA